MLLRFVRWFCDLLEERRQEKELARYFREQGVYDTIYPSPGRVYEDPSLAPLPLPDFPEKEQGEPAQYWEEDDWKQDDYLDPNRHRSWTEIDQLLREINLRRKSRRAVSGKSSRGRRSTKTAVSGSRRGLRKVGSRTRKRS